MQQTQNCGFFICGMHEGSLQERAQEQLSSCHSQEIAMKTQKITEKSHPHSPQPKEIFSFKLNCFRNTPNSDKHHLFPHQQQERLPETAAKLQTFRSCQKGLLKIAQSPPAHRQNQRFFTSPPPKVQFMHLREGRSPEVKRSMMVPSIPYHQATKVVFKTPSEAWQSQVDGNSKKSDYTHCSSKKSEVNFPQRSVQLGNQNYLDFEDKLGNRTDKRFLQKSCILGNHENGGQTQRTLIDCLNEEPLLTKNDVSQQQQSKLYGLPPGIQNHQIRVISYNTITGEQRIPMLRNHHQTIIVRPMAMTSKAIPCRINA